MKNEKIYQLIVMVGSNIIEDAKAGSKDELEMYKYNAIINLRKIYKNVDVSKHNVNNVEMYLVKVS